MPAPPAPPPRSGITRLLIASAMDPAVGRRLAESAETLFDEFALAPEERELLRHPDHRLLRLLGAALAEDSASAGAAPADAASPTAGRAALPPPRTMIAGVPLPDVSLVLTLVPCAQYEGEELSHFSYAVWVQPLAEGVDPATLPPPAGTVLPGTPLPPLHAVIRVSALQMQDPAGSPLVGLTATLQHATNIFAPPPSEAAGDPAARRNLQTPEIQSAIAAVRTAPAGERYQKILDLLHALHAEELP